MKCLIGLGSNTGDRHGTLNKAVDCILSEPSTSLIGRSTFYETTPAGMAPESQPFVNGVLAIETNLDARSLLQRLQDIETQLGRLRESRWDSRSIDLDILLCEDQVLALPDLQVPHPRMCFRSFVLRGASEIASDWLIPGLERTVRQAWDNLTRTPRYIAVIGNANTTRQMLRSLERDQVDCATCYASEDSSSGSFQGGEIEFLDQQRRKLQQCFGDQPVDRVLVSNFWLGTFAEVQARERWLQPSLLMLVGSPEDSAVDSLISRAVERWHELALDGALYELDEADVAWCCRELRGAVETLGAMAD